MLARRINPRLIRLHRSYSIEDAAFSLGVHKNSVRGWIRNGLPVMDRTRPLLMHGDELRAYLEAKRKAAQCPCTPGTLYCLKCRSLNATTGNLKALWDTYGTLMHRRVGMSAIAATMPDFQITIREARERLEERQLPPRTVTNEGIERSWQSTMW
jgi:hypothetical protein